MMLPLIALVLPLLVQCNPIEPQPRAACNSDDCLRELQHTSSLASSFCSSYYTKTTTTVTTTTIPALGATFPAIQKRYIDAPQTTAAPDPAALNRGLAARAATTTANFTSKCTEASTALSSGCSCLLGSNAATTTQTVTSTYTLPLPAACSSASSYGLYPTPLILGSIPNGQGASGLGFEVLPGGCCAYCLASPNCYLYYEVVDYVAQEPGKVGCSIGIIGGQPLEPLGDATCPLGLATLTAGAAETSILYGAGPCATVVTTAS